MSLNYDVSKVDTKFWKDATEADWDKTQSLIFSTIVVGMDTITQENCGEFYARLTVFERLVYGKEITTAADVAHRVGLQTNATRRTRAAFMHDVITKELDSIAKNFGYFADATTQSIKTV